MRKYSKIQYFTVYFSTVQYSTVQSSTVQYNPVQISTVQDSTVQYSTVSWESQRGRFEKYKPAVITWDWGSQGNQLWREVSLVRKNQKAHQKCEG